MTQRLLLFDIDGTLIHQGRMGSTALTRAFHDLHGVGDALREIRLDGKTDTRICREVIEKNGLFDVDPEKSIGRLIEVYLQMLREEARLRPSGRLCPGVEGLLDHLAPRMDCVVGLLTGNVREGAEIKLRTFGIWERFKVGAYGSDHEIRRELVPIAWARAHELTGKRFLPSETVIIGDTPADIDTAQHGGCVSVAVATGRYGLQELADHRPDWLLPDLADAARTFEALGLT